MSKSLVLVLRSLAAIMTVWCYKRIWPADSSRFRKPTHPFLSHHSWSSISYIIEMGHLIAMSLSNLWSSGCNSKDTPVDEMLLADPLNASQWQQCHHGFPGPFLATNPFSDFPEAHRGRAIIPKPHTSIKAQCSDCASSSSMVLELFLRWKLIVVFRPWLWSLATAKLSTITSDRLHKPCGFHRTNGHRPCKQLARSDLVAIGTTRACHVRWRIGGLGE